VESLYAFHSLVLGIMALNMDLLVIQANGSYGRRKKKKMVMYQ